MTKDTIARWPWGVIVIACSLGIAWGSAAAALNGKADKTDFAVLREQIQQLQATLQEVRADVKGLQKVSR